MASAIRTERLSLEPLAPETIRLLIQGQRTEAEQTAKHSFPPEFPSQDELTGFLTVQLRRMDESPERRDWMARLMVTHTGEVVGHCGFHGPPELVGRAEIGYTVFERFRRRGFAREAAAALVKWAFDQGEAQVFASVSPNNLASLALVRSLGFIEVGTQEDEVDGLELVFAIEPIEPIGPNEP